MKQALLFPLFFLMADAVFGQCPTDPVVLSSQGMVDDFFQNFPNCTEISTDLTITTGIFEDLSQFSSVKKITGKLTISNCTFWGNISGLQNIEEVGGLTILGNSNMLQLTSMGALKKVKGDVFVGNNPILENLGSLSKLAEVDGNFSAQNNPSMTSFSGLENLGYVGKDLTVNNLSLLENFQGLNSLAFVNGNFKVSNNSKLLHFSGLDNLEYVGQGFLVDKNVKLADFAGLEKLATVAIDFKVLNNTELVDFTGLSGLTGIGGVTEIIQNGITAFKGLTHLQSFGGYLTVSNNQKLVDFSGMPALTNIFGSLNIENNPALLSIGALPKFKTIGGSLKIYYNQVLESLVGLDSLETVTEDLSISYLPKIADLTGLGSLKTVGGNFFINNNLAMASLAGLENLKSVGLSMKISSNPVSDFSALNNLNTVGGSLEIRGTDVEKMENWASLKSIGGLLVLNNNQKLEEINGFNELANISSNFEITSNHNLKRLAGFSKIEAIGGDLTIVDNQMLNEVAGFDSLKIVAKEVKLYSNYKLSKILAFKNLKSIGRRFIFQFNYGVNSLDFFEKLDYIGWRIIISSNQNLAQCDALAICDKLASSPDSITLYGNAEGCNDKNDLVSTCTGIYSFAQGHVFVDFACDSLENGQDVVFPNKILRYMDDYPFATTNFWGDYVKLLKPGINYTFKTPEVLGFLPQPPSRSVKSQIYTDSFPHEDFRLCPDGELTNLCVSIAPSNNPRPGFTTNYHICVANLGNTWVPGTLILDIADPYSKGRIDSIWYSLAPAGVTGPAVIWNIDTLPPFQSTCIDVWIRWKTTLPLGDLVTTQVNISPNGSSDADNSNNIIALRQTSVGSFDPNDKAVNLPAIGLQIAQNRGNLDYQIRFQNTGNFPADFVHVVDTISPLLDTRTIEMLDASHPYILEFPAANVLKWRFENINLPDSTTDEPGSHGHLLFRIKTMPVNFQKDSVFNRCGIYFDYNEPVITNYTKTIITKEIVATSLPENGLFLQAAPNPTSEVCLVNFSLETADFCEMKLTDLAGRPVQIFSKRKFEAGYQSVPIDLRGLPGGVYFFEIKTGTKQGTIKVIKQ